MTNKETFALDKQLGIELREVTLNGERFLKISNHTHMRPFLMSIVSNDDHWMFIGSNGGLTAGKRNAEYALFPYYTDDKIISSSEFTGSKSIFRISQGGKSHVWEPFSIRFDHLYNTQRNLYKSPYGHQVIFEEINHDLGLSFQYKWSSSAQYGFVREAILHNLSNEAKEVKFVDGIQNILPYGVGSALQQSFSNLAEAYKRTELHSESGLGIYALSAIIADKAEPSEALKANVVWSLGLEKPTILLSSRQLEAFRNGHDIQEESDVKGESGAYFVSQTIHLSGGESSDWNIIAELNQSQSQVVSLIRELKNPEILSSKVSDDIKQGTFGLIQLISAADGLQNTADYLQDCRHFSNALFNVMRGGIFDDGYSLSLNDFLRYLEGANKEVLEQNLDKLRSLPTILNRNSLIQHVISTEDPDLLRLSLEYLPLKFSRRHGDPSRPWNRFSINIRDDKDNSTILDYEGNWRDIFQNWEALAYSYPHFIDGMIFKFLNASTFDGYNPYRITKSGFDWEVIEHDNPWSYIGYWGDHQIIYLQKFLELLESFSPGKLSEYLDRDLFVYAAVPYLIKPYADIVSNPKDTIEFDHEWDARIREKRHKSGADGALLFDTEGNIHRVNLLEKLLATLLAKLSNFIPDGGIWMNTQRPEWNDANNALVGNGVSMVTLYYLRRFLSFLKSIIVENKEGQVKISQELVEFYHSVRETFEKLTSGELGDIGSEARKVVIDELGNAASDYRAQIYKVGFWGKKRSITLNNLVLFLDNVIKITDRTINHNKREDGLYHAYNLLTYTPEGVHVHYLDEMLEGQVAVLSSGYLTPDESLEVLSAMKLSALFRPDQYSYLLYPNKRLPGFLEKNNIPQESISSSKLLNELISAGNKSIVERDVSGAYHFNGLFKNAGDLAEALDELPQKWQELMKSERKLILDIFEAVFNHKAFTGRSGTFFAFEGLGSIYWHMVSKLLLAVQECCLLALHEKSSASVLGGLFDHYYEIQAGIGVHKSPELYGAFPTDPYSHTPLHKGAQQPGMTGQVKEDIITRLIELGIRISNGCIRFDPQLLRTDEFFTEVVSTFYIDIFGKRQPLQLEEGQLFFTFCQVPVIYTIGDTMQVGIKLSDSQVQYKHTDLMSREDSFEIFSRSGKIEAIYVLVDKTKLK